MQRRTVILKCHLYSEKIPEKEALTIYHSSGPSPPSGLSWPSLPGQKDGLASLSSLKLPLPTLSLGVDPQ